MGWERSGVCWRDPAPVSTRRRRLYEGIEICGCQLAGDRARQESATTREVARRAAGGDIPRATSGFGWLSQRGGEPPGPRDEGAALGGGWLALAPGRQLARHVSFQR